MRFLVIDEHEITRVGIERVLTREFPGAQVCEAVDIDSGVEAYARTRPDIAIVELSLQGAGGMELLRRLTRSDPMARVIIFTARRETIYAIRAIKAGAYAYVAKSSPIEELSRAVQEVRAGQKYVDRQASAQIALLQIQFDDPLQRLTDRQIEILRLLALGKGYEQIASELDTAYKTIANSIAQMKRKLGAGTLGELIKLGTQLASSPQKQS